MHEIYVFRMDLVARCSSYHDNQSLVDYVNSQRLVNPLVCLGDGHDGVWNLVQEFGKTEHFER